MSICLTDVNFHHLIKVGPVFPLFNYHFLLTFSKSSDFFLDRHFRFFSVSLAGKGTAPLLAILQVIATPCEENVDNGIKA